MVGSLWDYDDSSHRVILRAETYRSLRRRKRSQDQLALSLLNRPRVVVLVVILITLIFLFLREARYALATNTQYQIENITINKLHYLTRDNVFELLNIKATDTLFNVSAKELVYRLEQDPDIEKAFVEKEYPDKIKVVIKERLPSVCIKLADSYKYFDSRGVLLQRYPAAGSVPVVSGLEIEELRPGEICSNKLFNNILNVLSQGRRLGWGQFIQILEVEISDPGRIFLKTQERISIVMDSDDIEAQLNKLMLVLRDVRDKGRIIKKVDLRFKDVVAE